MNPAKDIFKRAEQAARKGNSEYAIELYLQGLTLDPKAAEERRKLHLIESQVVEFAGGNPQGGMKTKLQTSGFLAKAKKFKVQKKWEEAIQEIERAIRPQPHNSALLYDLGECLEQIEAVDAALGIYEDVINVDKGHVEGYRKLGQLYAEQGDPKKAIEAWEKLKMYKPEDKEASKAVRDLAAQTLVQSVEDRKAESGDDSFRAMLKDEEESADLEKRSAVIRTDEDRVEAIRFKKEDLKKEPTNSRLWRELGQLYQDLRQFKYAQAAYKKALEVNPQDLFAVDKLGMLQEVVHKTRVTELNAAIEKVEQNGSDDAQLAELREKLKVAESGLLKFRIEEYERKVKAHPTDYELKVIYGDFLMQGEQFDAAIEQFQKAIKDPKFKVRAQNNMGQCFQAKGVHKIAVNQYELALSGIADADSDMAKSVRYNLATAFEAMGDKAAALEHYETIMATDIGYRDVSARVTNLMS